MNKTDVSTKNMFRNIWKSLYSKYIEDAASIAIMGFGIEVGGCDRYFRTKKGTSIVKYESRCANQTTLSMALGFSCLAINWSGLNASKIILQHKAGNTKQVWHGDHQESGKEDHKLAAVSGGG